MQFFQVFRKVQRFLSIALTGLLIFMLIEAGSLIRVASAASGTWTVSTNTSTTDDFYGIAYGNKTFVGVGMSGMTATSSNGMDWTASSVSCGTGLGVVYTGTKWVAACDGGQIFTSTDNGATWQSGNSTMTSQVSSLAYNGSVIVGVGANEQVITSTDGSTWSQPKTLGSGTNLLNFVAYGGGKFVAVGNNNALYVSSDGTNWAPGTLLL